MKRNSLRALGLMLILCMVVGGIPCYAEGSAGEIKNVIVMIPDGMDFDGVTLTRWYNGEAAMNMDGLVSGLVRTYWAGGPVTDSAPAASAMATGYKTGNGMISTLSQSTTTFMPGIPRVSKADEMKPIATVLEGARLKGMATGIVATCEFPHATPAAFASHYPERNEYDQISEQMVYQGVDVILAGGADPLTPGAGEDNRKDGEDLVAVIKAKGYDFVTNKDQMLASTSSKLWGAFAPMDIPNDMDRDVTKHPGLDEMTQKALSVLSKDEDGFFLMVEGSKIDWAAHANDPIGVISEINAFDRAVKVALDYAKADGHTAILIAPDHNTGGISISRRETENYNKSPLSLWIDPLKKAKVTGEGIAAKLNSDRSNIPEVMAAYFGITDLTVEEIAQIASAEADDMRYTVGPMISSRASIGWTSGGHTGGETVLFSYLPGDKRISGVILNSDIARYTAEYLEINLNATSETLFVKAETQFTAKGAVVTIDKSDENNPVLIVKKGSDQLTFPAYKNIAVLNGREITLSGVVVYNGVEFFVPKEAIALIQ